jgi:hypothetical protein
MNEEEEAEQSEWEAKVTENLKQLYEQSGCDEVKMFTIDGTAVSQKRGLVLISGNRNYKRGVRTEIYDYASKSFRNGPKMKIERWGHASVTLPNGNVAVFGGHNETDYYGISMCEIFDVKSWSFREIGHMVEKRWDAVAVLLQTGIVLIMGGFDEEHEGLKTCEFYNPTTNKFYRSKATLIRERSRFAASLLPDGRVLISGGYRDLNFVQHNEFYDPVTDSFYECIRDSMTLEQRTYHTATTLPDGKVLLVGGGEEDAACCSTEIYDPATLQFSYGPVTQFLRLVDHFAVLLPDGRVFVGGGSYTEAMQQATFYYPNTNSFGGLISLLHKRDAASAVLF